MALEKLGKRAEAIESYQRAKGIDQGNETASQGLSRLQGMFRG